jgi:DNA-binding IclR family transcriptional regulator
MSSEEDTRVRDDSGRYSSEVTPEDVLGVFETVEGPALTTTDVVNTFGCSREVARSRLSELTERGLVERRKSGRVVLWWRTDDTETPAWKRMKGALADTDVPEGMREERRRLREDWSDDDVST